LIGIKKIKEIINEKVPKKVKYVNLFCLHTFYIDGNLEAPGINFSVFAKFWVIQGNFSISLKGLKAKKITNMNNNSIGINSMGNCKDGAPGKPGQTGGSFYGKIMS
jgi:hypothetical protein